MSSEQHVTLWDVWGSLKKNLNPRAIYRQVFGKSAPDGYVIGYRVVQEAEQKEYFSSCVSDLPLGKIFMVVRDLEGVEHDSPGYGGIPVGAPMFRSECDHCGATCWDNNSRITSWGRCVWCPIEYQKPVTLQ